jgi:anti-sigma B factor antagonist
MSEGDRDLIPSVLPVVVDRESSTMAVTGAIDATTAPALRPQLIDLVQDAAAAGRIARLDLAAVDFVDSVGLTILVAAHEAARAAGGGLELSNVASGCRRVFEITHLDEVLVIREQEH